VHTCWVSRRLGRVTPKHRRSTGEGSIEGEEEDGGKRRQGGGEEKSDEKD
jgi:hypothetical protein